MSKPDDPLVDTALWSIVERHILRDDDPGYTDSFAGAWYRAMVKARSVVVTTDPQGRTRADWLDDTGISVLGLASPRGRFDALVDEWAEWRSPGHPTDVIEDQRGGAAARDISKP